MTSYQIWNESKVFDRLLDNIQRIIDNLIKKDKRLEFKLTDSWGAVYKKNDYTIPHQHLPNNISFVYYLQSTGNTPLIFDECNFKLNPTDDMLIIFPSYLWHSVSKHNEEKDRICIAGNLQFHF